MKILKRALCLSMPVLSLANTAVSFASDTTSSNAVVDIMNNQRYEGAMETIQGLTSIVDVGFMTYITFIAFFIISAAMLRNVLAGAYWAFPKFWDKVDAAHKEVADVGFVTQFKEVAHNYQNIGMGSISKAILRIVPNIKPLTDFEEDTVDPKAYFIKAIPQMIGVVMIGVFIYDGMYRDTAATVANFGAELFNRVMTSADPIAIYDRITGSAGRPEFSTDNDKTDKGKLVNKISESAYSKVISTYTDIKGAANKSSIAGQLEKHVIDQVEKHALEYASDNGSWDYTYDVTMTIGASNQSAGAHASDDKLQVAIVFDSLPISSLNLDSTKEVGVDWNLNVIINFKKKAKVTKTTTLNNLILYMRSSTTKSGSAITISLPSGTKGTLSGYSTTTIGGKSATISGNTIKFKDGMPSDTSNMKCVSVWYNDGSGRSHKIEYISWSNKTPVQAFIKSPDYSGMQVTYGDEIKADDMVQK